MVRRQRLLTRRLAEKCTFLGLPLVLLLPFSLQVGWVSSNLLLEAVNYTAPGGTSVLSHSEDGGSQVCMCISGVGVEC